MPDLASRLRQHGHGSADAAGFRGGDPAPHYISEIPCKQQGISAWAHLDLNQGPHPYQGCALTRLSYGPGGPVSVPAPEIAYLRAQRRINLA